MDYTILMHSIRNVWVSWHKKLVEQYGTTMIVPEVLRAYAKLENGKAPVIYLEEQNNPIWGTAATDDTTQNLIGRNDGFIALAYKQVVKKVTNNAFQAAIPYTFANNVVFDASNEFAEIHGMLRYSKLTLAVSDSPVLTNFSSELFYDVPNQLLATAGSDVTNERDSNFESYTALPEVYGFHGDVRNTITFSLGGGSTTIAGDPAVSAEQNYVGFHILGYRLKDGAEVVKGMINAQNKCELP